MFCKKIEESYRPNILWAPWIESWVGYYNFRGDRYMMSLSDNHKEDRAQLEKIFNWHLIRAHKAWYSVKK